MSLPDLIGKKVSIIEEIEANDGEISPKNELDLANINVEITQSTDAVVGYRIWLKEGIENYKEILKAFISKQEKKLNRFDDFLKMTLREHGTQKTMLSNLSLRTKESKSVVVYDFDLCSKSYPEAVQINTFDNIRTITLLKTVLKEFAEKDAQTFGFTMVNNNSEWVSSTIRTKKDKENE